LFGYCSPFFSEQSPGPSFPSPDNARRDREHQLMTSVADGLELTDIDGACRIIGGQDTPVSPATYYRGVKAGIYTAPFHPSPNVSRVDAKKLRADVRRIAESAAKTGQRYSAEATPTPA
jgi:hypothetical protein